MTITPEDCLIHWPSTFIQGSNTRLADEAITLPYQEGIVLCDTDALTEVTSNSGKAGMAQAREVLMIRRPLPMPPTAPELGLQMNQNRTYHPTLLSTMASPRAKNEPEKEGTN
jgi:hypothetical protein